MEAAFQSHCRLVEFLLSDRVGQANSFYLLDEDFGANASGRSVADLEAGWLARDWREKKDSVRKCGDRDEERIRSERVGFICREADADSAFEDSELNGYSFSG